MKISLRHYYVLIIFLTVTCSFSYAQKILEGYIFDKTSEKPLSYAAILIGSRGLYTTSNEDGRFEIFFKQKVDSLEIRYLGYKTAKVSVNYFRSKKIYYLTPLTTTLDEVVVSTKKPSRALNKSIASSEEKASYRLLYELLKKYRKKKTVIDSKAYFTLNSKSYSLLDNIVDTIPIEQIEALYSSRQQLSKGILDLEIKTGRFGQNQKSPFYSLYHISLLKNFNLFKKKIHFLPQYVGNMSLNKIKKRYHLKLQKTANYNGTIIYFQPKIEKGDIFSGKIFFQQKELIIEKIELFIKNPKYLKLSPIVKGDSLSIKNLNLNILFNPIDLNKIQYYDFDIDIVYYSNTLKNNISSKAFLYLYDYNTSFTNPYFTNIINFENEYDKILALPVSDKIWSQNYPYPKSKKNTEIANFFKGKDQFYSYFESKIPQEALTHIKTSSIIWNSQRKLLFKDLKKGPGISLNFSYALNPYENNDGTTNYTIYTLFDSKTSFFKPKRTLKELDCINLTFDIYELNRLHLLTKIRKSMTFQDVKDLANKAIVDAKVTSRIMFEESMIDLENDKFNYWKAKIHDELKKYNRSSE